MSCFQQKSSSGNQKRQLICFRMDYDHEKWNFGFLKTVVLYSKSHRNEKVSIFCVVQSIKGRRIPIYSCVLIQFQSSELFP